MDDKGEYETGCYYEESNDMALCSMSDSAWHDQAGKLCWAWAEFVRGQAVQCALNGTSMRMTAFAWLLGHCGGLYDRSLALTLRSNLSDNAKRDWFCWLYRWMKDQAQEQARYPNQQYV